MVHAACKPGEGAGSEFLQIEGGVIENGAGFGIGGKQNLEAAIEEKAFDLIGTDAAADAVRGFQNLKRNVRFVKAARGA